MPQIVSVLAVVLSAAGAVQAEDWPHWRGPNFNGSAEQAHDLPTDFSQTKHVKWTAKMIGPAAATPIIHNDRVFISDVNPDTETLLAICLDRETGEVRWQHKTGSGYQKTDRSNYASPSPVTDGERVIFFYGTGDLAAFSMDGKKLWARNIQADYGKFAFLWTFSASPTLYDGKLYLQVLQRDQAVRGNPGGESYLLIMDPASGETLHRQVRPSKAVGESHEAYSTPIPHEYKDRREIVIAGGDALTGHDPDTGKELWRWGTWNPERIGHWRLVPSPVTGGGVVLGCAPKRGPAVAVKAGLSGDVSGQEAAVAWKSGRRSPVTTDVPTPLFYRDHFFVLSDVRRALSKVDPQTGEIVWSVDLRSRPKFRASPTGADGKVWFINHAGEVFIHDAKTGEQINRIPLGGERADRIRASIAVAGDELFIRTSGKLYCIEK